MLLKWFQECGHRPLTLMGGGTVLLGDPSGKDAMRTLIDPANVNKNIAKIKPVFAKYLDYNDSKNGAIMVNNYDWIEPLNYVQFLREVGQHLPLSGMLAMDSVKNRLDREQGITFLEFNYMVLQAFDFVELHKRHNVTIQMGGSDQWGNIVRGVDLGRRMEGYNLFAFTTPLLQTSSGAKMGKSAAGAVWLNADMCSPYEYYQYWRNTEDADVVRWLKIYTMLPMDEINKLEKLEGAEINEAKKILAFEATKLCHGEAAAIEAQDTAQKTFEQGLTGEALPHYDLTQNTIDNGATIIDVAVELNIVKSKGEIRRLIDQGGVKINDQKIDNHDAQFKNFDAPYKLQIGKKNISIIRPN